MVELKGSSVSDGSHVTSVISAHYELTHSQGGRSGTCLKLNLTVERTFGKVRAKFTDLQPEVPGDDAEAALDKLAEWCERAAAALRERGKPVSAVTRYERP